MIQLSNMREIIGAVGTDQDGMTWTTIMPPHWQKCPQCLQSFRDGWQSERGDVRCCNCVKTRWLKFGA